MNKFAAGWVAALVCLAGSSAQAQFYTPPATSPFYRPPVSPMINLYGGGLNAGINYFGIVQPQQRMAASIQQLQQTNQMLLQGGAAGGVDPLTGMAYSG